MVSEEKKGSDDKARESRKQMIIDRCRKRFEAEKDDLLTVKISVTLNEEAESKNLRILEKTMESLHELLIKHDFDSMKITENIKFDLIGSAKASVTKASRNDWYLTNDRIGWVNHDPLKFINNRIAEKARKLDEYKNNVGPDVRLLLFANCKNISGKIRFREQSDQLKIDTRGFNTVYFLSYPDDAFEFRRDSVIEM